MSSTYNDVRSAIENRINTEMNLAPSYSVSYQNVPFAPPNNAPWLQVFIRFGDNAHATLLAPGNSGFNRLTGTLVANIFTQKGIGAGENLVIAERIKDLFDRAKFSGIIFDSISGPSLVEASVIETGVSPSAGLAAAYFQTQVVATFSAYLD